MTSSQPLPGPERARLSAERIGDADLGLGAMGGVFAGLSNESGGGVVGVGTDIVDIARFAATLARTPALAERIFTAGELFDAGRRRSAASLAARFAAKEAAGKALWVPPGAGWYDAEVVTQPNGAPLMRVSGALAEAAHHRGVTQWQVSLTHDAGIAMAIVLALS